MSAATGAQTLGGHGGAGGTTLSLAKIPDSGRQAKGDVKKAGPCAALFPAPREPPARHSPPVAAPPVRRRTGTSRHFRLFRPDFPNIIDGRPFPDYHAF